MLTGDLVTAAQKRIDRLNAPKPDAADWLVLLNESVQELYGLLCATYEDYNITRVQFTLTGGSETGNQLTVGVTGTTAQDFYQPRKLDLVLAGNSPTPYVTIPKLNSLPERNLYSLPNIVPYYGAIPSAWHIYGSTIEILPLTVNGATYMLWYVPLLPQFTDLVTAIDKYWVTCNGWQAYAICRMGEKAAAEIGEFDIATKLQAEAAMLRDRIVREAKPRDVSEPGRIVDMKRVRNLWRGGLPGGGFGSGWGWGDDGEGNW